VLLVLVMLGSVAGTVVGMMALFNTIDKDLQKANIEKDIPNAKILNTADDLRSDYDVYIVNKNVLKRTRAIELYNNLAKRIKRSGFVVVLYKVDKNEKRKFLEAWLKALTKAGYKMSVIPISKVSKDKKSLKIDERVLTADLIALSAKPFGMFIYVYYRKNR